jgi:catechol-2,3-dioxygenase
MFFHDVVMESRSPRTMLSYYGGTLELPVVAEDDVEVAVRAGETTLRFRRAAPGTSPTYHFALRVPGEAFAQAKEWLAARTELVREDGDDEFDWSMWGARAAYAHDPEGNVIELMAFPALAPAGGWAGAPSFVGLAELGLPVADPPAAAGMLSDAFGIGTWDGEEVPTDALTPVGEQGASFLLTPVGRTWLFGGPAADHPLEVVLGDVPEAAVAFDDHPYRVLGRPR